MEIAVLLIPAQLLACCLLVPSDLCSLNQLRAFRQQPPLPYARPLSLTTCSHSLSIFSVAPAREPPLSLLLTSLFLPLLSLLTPYLSCFAVLLNSINLLEAQEFVPSLPTNFQVPLFLISSRPIYCFQLSALVRNSLVHSAVRSLSRFAGRTPLLCLSLLELSVKYFVLPLLDILRHIRHSTTQLGRQDRYLKGYSRSLHQTILTSLSLPLLEGLCR